MIEISEDSLVPLDKVFSAHFLIENEYDCRTPESSLDKNVSPDYNINSKLTNEEQVE